ncbi:hypothetical protein CHUAL_009850 [Chamberlinius hualienensis]
MEILPKMAQRKSILLLLIVLLYYSTPISAQAASIPDELLKCYLKDKTKLESCLLQAWSKLFIAAKTGDPKVNLPRAEPLIIKNIIWKEDAPTMNINCVLSNFTINGLTNSKLTTITVDKKARKVSYNTSTPFINVTTEFSVNGTVLLLPIKGKGRAAINATNMVLYGTADLVQVGTTVNLQNVKSTIDMKNISFKFVETDNSDPLWEALTNLIAENTELLLGDIQPALSAQVGNVTQLLANAAYKKMPVDAFIT